MHSFPYLKDTAIGFENVLTLISFCSVSINDREKLTIDEQVAVQ